MRAFRKTMAALPAALIALSASAGLAVAGDARTESIINSLDLKSGTRGIKLGGATSAAQPAPVAHRVSTAQPSAQQPRPHTVQTVSAQASGPSYSEGIPFPSGSAELTPAARAALDFWGKALTSDRLAGNRFRIVGHTDTVGSAEENMALSQRRAESVANYLVSQYGIPPARLEAQGMGQAELAVPTPPQTPEARNRRVQVINISG